MEISLSTHTFTPTKFKVKDSQYVVNKFHKRIYFSRLLANKICYTHTIKFFHQQ